MEQVKKWQQDIFTEIKNNGQRKVVLIAGASGSGKSHNAKLLCEFLNDKGLRACVFSADNYYKGVSRIIVEKMFLNELSLKAYENKKSEIIGIVKSVIMNYPSTEKFCVENKEKIYDAIHKYISKKDAEKIVKELEREYANINFDEPFALQLDTLVKDINSLIMGKDIVLPSYSFATSEVEFLQENTLSGNYDVYIIEGLYVLRGEVFGTLDSNKVVPALIDCDIKTLLSRRLNRDIKSGRTTFSPEQTIVSTLTKTMPSYCEYIEPFNKNSRHTLSSTLTPEEIDKKENSSQLKFKVNTNQLRAINALNLNVACGENQVDYYFQGGASDDFIVRLREVNGQATKLTFKNNTKSHSNINRKIEEYDLSGFSSENKSIKPFLENFIKSGFKLDKIIDKNRIVYLYKGITIKLDNVKDIGTFIEFDKLTSDTKNIINILKLKDVCTTPYLYLATENKKENSVEKEFKFVVNKIPSGISNKTQITQVYLDLEKTLPILEHIFNSDLSNIKSARIRIAQKEKQSKFYLTLKSSGGFEREEKEIEITKSLAWLILKDGIKAKLSKTRYVLNKNGTILEFDEFKNGVKLVEVEVASVEDYKKVVKILTEMGLQFSDVTDDQNYKNENLANIVK